MQKRIYIVHGWGGKPNEHWLPWLKKSLETKGFAVYMPEMPNTNQPVIKEWVEFLAEVVETPDENTYFIGHSIGAQTILRYLETIPNKKVGGCVFVAGWFKLENLENVEEEKIAGPWVKDDIDFKKVLSTSNNFTVINSNNDDYGAVEENKFLFEEKLGAEVKIMKNMGHFTEYDGVTELPEVVEAILNFSSPRKQP